MQRFAFLELLKKRFVLFVRFLAFLPMLFDDFDMLAEFLTMLLSFFFLQTATKLLLECHFLLLALLDPSLFFLHHLFESSEFLVNLLDSLLSSFGPHILLRDFVIELPNM